ncbi:MULTISPECIES: hypothetical protein [Niastella]|uniref:Secreted protein n=1 Tax=Niastella soli TaxID=2821487 RepID=A0ABS3YSS2_9BACT|nr:hypothetical protein [Niastella soli]MBO9200969.1 hypothetical protein [Niastella soli]
MNKVKVAFIAFAIFAGVGGAFGTTCVQCENSPQYIWTGAGYMRVGLYGEDWDCFVAGGICTYWIPDPIGQPNVYAPCHEGSWFPL